MQAMCIRTHAIGGYIVGSGVVTAKWGMLYPIRLRVHHLSDRCTVEILVEKITCVTALMTFQHLYPIDRFKKFYNVLDKDDFKTSLCRERVWNSLIDTLMEGL